jgi:hypothetical protein
MSFPMLIKPAAFVLHVHVPLASLATRLGFHVLGSLPQRSLG